jgi:hypothetical protein
MLAFVVFLAVAANSLPSNFTLTSAGPYFYWAFSFDSLEQCKSALYTSITTRANVGVFCLPIPDTKKILLAFDSGSKGSILTGYGPNADLLRKFLEVGATKAMLVGRFLTRYLSLYLGIVSHFRALHRHARTASICQGKFHLGKFSA